MKNRLILILVSMGFILRLSAQCPQHEVELTTQVEVDNFKINYPGCTVIMEYIIIEGDDITSLHGLDGITSVNNLTIVRTPNLVSLKGLDSITFAFLLTIENTGITNLEGLNALDSVRFFLRMANNPFLTDLTGLDKLRYTNSLSVSNNPQLSSLAGLSNLAAIENLGIDYNPLLVDLTGMPLLKKVNELYVGNNLALQSLTGLEAITDLKKDLIIEYNPSLTSLHALEQVTSCKDLRINGNSGLHSLAGLGSLFEIHGDFIVTGNEGLVSLEELDGLKSIEGNLEINDNVNLELLSSFNSLRTIGGRLSIINNEKLTSLYGFDMVDSIGEVIITFNDFLGICSVQSICDHLMSGGPATIGGNFNGCESKSKVLEGCTVATQNNFANQISIYPNPTNAIIYIDGLEGENLRFDVYSTIGKIYSKVDTGLRQIDLSQLPGGLYYLNIHTDSKSVAKVILKE